ncbi:MAG: DHH family phosphoesterase [Phycisphaerales bacterium]
MPVNADASKASAAPAPGAWSSTTDLPALAAWLRSRRRVVIVTHVKPDGDAIGSTMAVTRALNLLRPGLATPWYFGPLPDWFPDVAAATPHRIITEQDRAEHDHAEEPDGVLILDTGSWMQLHDIREWLLKRTEMAAVLDHHRQGHADVAPRRVIMPEVAAVCQPAAELCRLLLGTPRVGGLPAEIAEPLYLGLATDTGWFQHSNTSPALLRMAADLLEAGVNHARLYELTEQRDRPARLRLMARALASLELLERDTVALMTLKQSDFHDSRAAPQDSGGFVQLGLTVASVQVCILLTESFVHDASPITKVSLRSKSGPDAPDVNAIAGRLGGGGHIRAAGAKVSADLATTRARVIEAVLAERAAASGGRAR